MLTSFEKGIIALVKSGLTNEQAALPQDFDIECIYPVAAMHQVRALMFCGAVASGIDSGCPVMKRLFDGLYSELLSSERQREQYTKLTALFEENAIDYMPLKGVLLKELYPQPEMRCMGDIDILVKPSQYEKIEKILIDLGCEHRVDSDHEYIWRTQDGVSLELHKRLIPSYNKDYYAYFGDGWEIAKKADENGFLYKMTPEDEFVYLFTHFSKHYRDGGIGIKHLTDLKVYVDKVNPDIEQIAEEMKKLGLYEFFQNVLRTIAVWFDGAEGDAKTDLVTKTVIESGVYGLSRNKAASSVLREAANGVQDRSAARLFRMLFLPYKAMCEKYPYLKKYPVLLPIAYVVRIADAVFNKPKRVSANIKYIKATTSQRVDEYERSLKEVGLEYNFKE